MLHNRGEWNLVCGAQRIEKLTFKQQSKNLVFCFFFLVVFCLISAIASVRSCEQTAESKLKEINNKFPVKY